MTFTYIETSFLWDEIQFLALPVAVSSFLEAAFGLPFIIPGDFGCHSAS